ncbi:MAG: hypothetical protein ACJ72Y_08990 [Actinomycetes bacterium]
MDELGEDRQRLVRLGDRLRSMTEAALTRNRNELGGESVASSVHRVCVWAAAQQGIPAPVPVLHPLASADQLTVIGRDFLAWVESNEASASGEAQSAAGALGTWRTELDRIRRSV